MIKFVTGDFFDYDATIRVNTVNCVGVMGAGVALLFKNKFPRMNEEYVKACERGYVKPGEPHVWEDNGFFGSNIIIINFPTKDHWRNPSEYEYIEKGLSWLRAYLKEKGDVTITIPALGCGHGGLDWNRVKTLMLQYLDGLDSNILIFEPKSSTATELPTEVLSKLEMEETIRVSPSDPMYPRKLQGRSAFDLYLKGDQAVFNKKTISIVIDPKADDREINAVIKCIDVLTSYHYVFLLGYSNSVEISLVKEVLKRNAAVILVLPYGILELKIRKDLKPFWDEKCITIVSVSKPRSPWSVGESINALKFRFKAADVVLIANYNFEILEKYEKELKQKTNAIFFINYWNSKIDFYQRINARQIGKNKETDLPNLQPILEIQN